MVIFQASTTRTYPPKSHGNPFYAHQTANYLSMAHLFEDVIASVDSNGKLITWKASSGFILSQLQGAGTSFNDLAVMQDDKLLFFSSPRNIGDIEYLRWR